MNEIAAIVARNDELRREWSAFLRGIYFRKPDEYPPLLFDLFLHEDRLVAEAINKYAKSLQVEESRRKKYRRPTGGGWYTPRLTDDPVANKWEEAIARGETPTFE